MADKSLTKELEEICSKITGKWHAKRSGEELNFSKTERILNPSPLELTDKMGKRHKTSYTIGIHAQASKSVLTNFYFEIKSNKNRFLIKEITDTKMTVFQLDIPAKARKNITYTKI